MAGIADMLIGSALQHASDAPDLAGSFGKGVELATHIEGVKQKRMELEQAKQKQQTDKLDKVGSMFEAASKMPDGAGKNAFTKEYIPKAISAMGLSEMFEPTVQKMLTGDPRIASVVANGIRSGDLTVQDLQDPAAIAAYASANKIDASEIEATKENYTGAYATAQKDKIEEDNKLRNAKATAAAALTRQEQAQGAAGEVEAEKAIGKSFAEYKVGGGKAGMASALSDLKEVAGALKTGNITSGGVSTRLPWLKSDDVQSMINPEMVKLKTKAQGALNTVLRATLGAQFTEGEGQRVLNQVWDDRLSPAANADKVDRKIRELQLNVKDKESEFIKRGYMKKDASADNVSYIKSKKDGYEKLPSGEKKSFIDKLAAAFNMTPAEIKKQLEGN